MPNYSNSVIYKIVCNNKSIHDMYIGSTCSFISRKAQHKTCCNNPTSKKYNRKIYKCIRGLGGWDAWSMIPILQYPCESKMALHIKEREIMESYNATLNCNSPYNTETEAIEKHKISNKKWIQNNPEKRKISIKKWNDANPDYMKKYAKDNAESIKQLKKDWVKNNPEKYKISKKKWRDTKGKCIVTCECGHKVTRSYLSTHMKSTKHFTMMESIVNQI